MRLLIKAINEASPKVMPFRTHYFLVRHDRKAAQFVVNTQCIGEEEYLELCTTKVIANNRCVQSLYAHVGCAKQVLKCKDEVYYVPYYMIQSAHRIPYI